MDGFRASDPRFGYNMRPMASSQYGRIVSEMERKAMSDRAIKIEFWKTGHTPEAWAKGAATRRGRKMSAKRCAQMSATFRALSDEIKDKLKRAALLKNLGSKASPETRAKLSMASKGRPKSVEHASKIGEAHRQLWKTDREFMQSRRDRAYAKRTPDQNAETKAKQSLVRAVFWNEWRRSNGMTHSARQAAAINRDRRKQGLKALHYPVDFRIPS